MSKENENLERNYILYFASDTNAHHKHRVWSQYRGREYSVPEGLMYAYLKKVKTNNKQTIFTIGYQIRTDKGTKRLIRCVQSNARNAKNIQLRTILQPIQEE